MSRYELLYIIPATFSENEIQPVIDGVTKELTKLNAKIIRNDMVGKLKLAYPVKKVRHGYYILVDMEIEVEKLPEIDKAFRLHTDVLRHHVVIKDMKEKPVFKLASIEEVDRERALSRATVREPKSRQAAVVRKVDSDKKVKVNMEEIDKKLDNILEGKIL